MVYEANEEIILSLGSKNESFVIKSLKSFLSQYCFEVFHGPFEMGLVVKTNETWIAASVDGLVSIRKHGTDELLLCSLELKTICATKTLVEAEVRVSLETSLLKWCHAVLRVKLSTILRRNDTNTSRTLRLSSKRDAL